MLLFFIFLFFSVFFPPALTLKNRFIEHTLNAFTLESVTEVYGEFMGEGAPLSQTDANRMTDHYYVEGSEEPIKLEGDTLKFDELDPEANSCYKVVNVISERATTMATKLMLLDEKLDVLAPMWDEIKVRSAHNVREAVKWFLEDQTGELTCTRGQDCRQDQYIQAIDDVVNLFRDDQERDTLVEECTLGSSELETVMSPAFVAPVTDFLSNMEQLAWEGTSCGSCLLQTFFVVAYV